MDRNSKMFSRSLKADSMLLSNNLVPPLNLANLTKNIESIKHSDRGSDTENFITLGQNMQT